MKIYGRANAWNVRKVLFLAEELGLDYERLDYGRGFKPATAPEILALNPNGLVPVLSDGEIVLWESHTILRYLALKYGPEALYPPALLPRVTVDQWLDWKQGHLGPVMFPLFQRYFLKLREYPDSEIVEAETEAVRLFTVLDGQLAKTGAYVAGRAFTIADCAIGMAVHRWLTLLMTRPDLSNVATYYARLSDRESFQKTVAIGLP